MKSNHHFALFCLLSLIVLSTMLFGCNQTEPAELAQAEGVVTQAPATEPVSTETTQPTGAATLPPDTPTIRPTATDVPAPATATAIPTSTLPPTATQEPTATATPEPTATETVEPTATPEPDQSSSQEEDPEEESGEDEGQAPAQPAPTATQAQAAAPASGTVSQPPYEASSCSDKYPCNDDPAGWEARIQVPAGYSDQYFAYLPNQRPTGLAFGPDGLLYVATQGGTIYTVNTNGVSAPYVSGFIAPTGIAFRPGTSQLYVSSRVREDNVNGEGQVSIVEGGGIRQIIGGLPCCYAFMHGPHGIAFGNDGFGYVGVGARSDHGEIIGSDNVQDEIWPNEAGILRFSPDGSSVEKFASGLRNPYGVAIDANGQIYATDNGPDYGPPDELHRIVPGANHGFPWYGCEECFPTPAGVNPLQPTYNFPAHSSPTGITVYTGGQFPGAYNNLFVALWSAFPGAQKVMRFGPGGVGASNFATGFAAPIAVTTDPAGNLYVADWATGIIFKISYTG